MFSKVLSQGKPILEDLLRAPHRPYFLTQRLTLRLADAYDAGHTKNPGLLPTVQGLIFVLVVYRVRGLVARVQGLLSRKRFNYLDILF